MLGQDWNILLSIVVDILLLAWVMNGEDWNRPLDPLVLGDILPLAGVMVEVTYFRGHLLLWISNTTLSHQLCSLLCNFNSIEKKILPQLPKII